MFFILPLPIPYQHLCRSEFLIFIIFFLSKEFLLRFLASCVYYNIFLQLVFVWENIFLSLLNYNFWLEQNWQFLHFQHLKYFTLLSFCLHCFWEVGCNSYLCFYISNLFLNHGFFQRVCVCVCVYSFFFPLSFL